MKTLILLAGMAIAATPAQAGTTEALASMRCAGEGIAQAFKGDFSNWVLPNFIGGNHLRAGQYIMPDGLGGCVVKGAPNGPLS